MHAGNDQSSDVFNNGEIVFKYVSIISIYDFVGWKHAISPLGIFFLLFYWRYNIDI